MIYHLHLILSYLSSFNLYIPSPIRSQGMDGYQDGGFNMGEVRVALCLVMPIITIAFHSILLFVFYNTSAALSLSVYIDTFFALSLPLYWSLFLAFYL